MVVVRAGGLPSASAAGEASRSSVSRPPPVGLTLRTSLSELTRQASGIAGFGRRRRNAVHPGREMQPRRGPLRKSLRTLARALDDPSSRLNLFVSVCVVLSTLFFLLETSEEFLALLRAHWPLPAVYFSLEAFCIGVFTLEIVAKLALAKRRLRLLMPLHRDGRAFWIDVAATATWYATVGPHSILAQRDVTSGRPNLAFLRLVRLFRVLRTLRLAHFSGVAVFTTALFESIPQLSALFFYLGILGVFMACMIHSFEADGPAIAAAALNASGCPADPLAASEDELVRCRVPYLYTEGAWTFTSIPASFWFTFVSLTSVGYGDSFPLTALGMLLSAMAAVLGNFIFAVPITVIGTNYDRLYHEMVRERILNALLQSVRKHLQLEAHKRAELMKEKKGRVMLSSAFLLLGYSPSRTKAARVTTLNRALLRDLLYAPIKGRKRQLADYAEVWEKIVAAWAALYPDEDAISGKRILRMVEMLRRKEGRWAAVADAEVDADGDGKPDQIAGYLWDAEAPKSRWATTAKSLLSGVDLPGTNNSSPSPQCRRASASAAAGPARDRAADLKWCEGAAQALAAKAARKVAANGRDVEVHDLG